MSFLEICLLFSLMVALAVIPSSSVALVVARSSTAGFFNGAAVAAGIVAGDIVYVVMAVIGMAELASVLGGWFSILRYLAGMYLIWFGINILRQKIFIKVESDDISASTLGASFFSGLILTLGDVKAIFFYASLFPAFIDLATITNADIVTIIIITVISVGGVKLAYAYFARKLISYFMGYKAPRTIELTAGSLLAGAGAYIITKT